MSNIFEKWNKEVDLDGLSKDIEEAKAGGVEFKEVPLGDYVVGVEKIELRESRKGDPMVSIWFKIVEGEFKNSRIFYNQVVTQGFQIHILNEFLRSLESLIDIEFKDFQQYSDLLLDIGEDIEEDEYLLRYGKNAKGFNTYEIRDIFDR